MSLKCRRRFFAVAGGFPTLGSDDWLWKGKGTCPPWATRPLARCPADKAAHYYVNPPNFQAHCPTFHSIRFQSEAPFFCVRLPNEQGKRFFYTFGFSPKVFPNFKHSYPEIHPKSMTARKCMRNVLPLVDGIGLPFSCSGDASGSHNQALQSSRRRPREPFKFMARALVPDVD